MAAHLRKQIREAVATAVTGLATTGSRVFQSRRYALEATDLPCLRVYTTSERSEATTIGYPRTYERRLTVAIEAIAKSAADVDDTLDQICKEVEVALGTQGVALGGAKFISLQSTEADQVVDAQQPTGQAAMFWEAVYMNAENAPDVAL